LWTHKKNEEHCCKIIHQNQILDYVFIIRIELMVQRHDPPKMLKEFYLSLLPRAKICPYA
jgi:hypothetical protein